MGSAMLCDKRQQLLQQLYVAVRIACLRDPSSIAANSGAKTHSFQLNSYRTIHSIRNHCCNDFLNRIVLKELAVAIRSSAAGLHHTFYILYLG